MFTRFRIFATLGAAAALLSGCAASPAPPPTPAPVFTSDADAFAAAEETYRAYVDALNAVDLSDPETFEAVYALTTDSASEEARTLLSQMHADGWRVSGHSDPKTVLLQNSYPSVSVKIELAVCLDVSSVELLDAAGTSMVDAGRPDTQSMLVQVTRESVDTNKWAVASITGRNSEPRCE